MAFHGSGQQTSNWAPQQYDKFKRERQLPLLDLIGMCRPSLFEGSGPIRVVDLGCGTGETTKLLHTQLATKLDGRPVETVGVDSSETMLASGHRHASECEGLRFVQGDLATFSEDDRFDLVFSNAALHWVPDHKTLFPSLLERLLKPNGQIAFQMPQMAAAPTHQAATRLAHDREFSAWLGGYASPMDAVLEPEDYAHILDKAGMRQSDVRVQIYPHYLSDRSQAAEWVKGSLLTEFRDRLPPEAYATFVQRYEAELTRVLPDSKPIFFPYRRVLMWACRAVARH